MDLAPGVPNPIDVYRRQPPALPVPAPVQMAMNTAAPVLPTPVAPMVAPAPHVPTQMEMDTNELNRIKNTGAGVDQIQNPFLRGLARAGDIAASVFAPGIARSIPGTTLHHLALENRQEQRLAADQKEAKSAADIANIESQSNERDSNAKKADALAAADTPLPITAELAAAAGAPELEGTSLSPKDYQRLVANHQTVQGRITTNARTNDTKETINGDKIDAAAEQGDANRASHESIAAAANKTRMLVAQMHDATSRANNVNTNNHKNVAGKPDAEGNYKVPADITRRASLANNVRENADAVDKLVDQRPDIIGAGGGRYTSVQQMIGSDDPAIAELGVRMHNIALASNGAHGVRAQQAIAQTEQELFNHFKSGPHAIHAAMGATRDSMQTFLDDEKNFSGSGKRTGAQGGGDAKPDYVFVPGKGLVKQ